jgi:AcrR family transcriptional regulator
MLGGPSEGLRERKKRAAREAIAATARRLFAERGFDAVTVAEVAAAADVSEKTVFNHFATKEDLAFAGREEGIALFVAAIAERPPRSSVLDVFRAMTHTVLDVFVAGGDEDLLAVAKIIRGSRALQERLTVGWESGAAAITAVIAETSGADDDDLVPRPHRPHAVVHAPLDLPRRAERPAGRGGPRAARRPTPGGRRPRLRPARRRTGGVRQARLIASPAVATALSARPGCCSASPSTSTRPAYPRLSAPKCGRDRRCRSEACPLPTAGQPAHALDLRLDTAAPGDPDVTSAAQRLRLRRGVAASCRIGALRVPGEHGARRSRTSRKRQRAQRGAQHLLLVLGER